MEELRSQPLVMNPIVALALSIEQGDYIEPRFEPPCPRFDEIRQFLYANRTSLILDTMDFEIPEHLLYSYVVAAGLTDLTPTDWRGFLIRCNRTAELFTWRELNSTPAATHGFVVRIDAGWPTPPPPQQVQPIDADVRQLFRHGFTNTAVNKQLFGIGYEFDKDLLRSLMNTFLYDDGPTNKQFSEDELDKRIAYFVSKNMLCEPGAEGIIRRL